MPGSSSSSGTQPSGCCGTVGSSVISSSAEKAVMLYIERLNLSALRRRMTVSPWHVI